MAEQRLGSSGVFKAIVMSARKFKRAVTGEDEHELTPQAEAVGNAIAQAFVAGRFADLYAMGSPHLQEQTDRGVFESRWRDAVQERGGTLTGFEVSSLGRIDIGFIPGLEEVPPEQLAAFLEIVFSTPDVALDDDKAFVIGAVLLEDAGKIYLGALHTR